MRLENLTPLIAATKRAPGLPRLGRIAAGLPLEAIEETEREELLALLTAPGRYALQVGDDSMRDAGILAGDYVVVQSRQQAAQGDIVVALIDGERVVLKRIRFRGGGRIELCAEHAGAEPELLAAERVAIQGTVAGQVRRYR